MTKKAKVKAAMEAEVAEAAFAMVERAKAVAAEAAAEAPVYRTLASEMSDGARTRRPPVPGRAQGRARRQVGTRGGVSQLSAALGRGSVPTVSVRTRRSPSPPHGHLHRSPSPPPPAPTLEATLAAVAAAAVALTAAFAAVAVAAALAAASLAAVVAAPGALAAALALGARVPLVGFVQAPVSYPR